MLQGRWLPLSLLLFACQLPNEAPPPAAAPPSAPSSDEPAPLPPEETPPPETEAAPPPADPKPVEPGITTNGAPTRGTLPKAVIDEKLKSLQPGITACYEKALKQKPELRGNVNINFVVAPDGKVAYTDAADGDDALNRRRGRRRRAERRPHRRLHPGRDPQARVSATQGRPRLHQLSGYACAA
jgi:hypothetical protein